MFIVDQTEKIKKVKIFCGWALLSAAKVSHRRGYALSGKFSGGP
jgi:hypothetical protein